MASSKGPEPVTILAKAAAVENGVTMLIASRVCADAAAFGLFMRYAADRIPIAEKIRMLSEIVAKFPDGAGVYAGLADDLRAINEARRFVAHAIYIGPGVEGVEQGYAMYRKGRMTQVSDEEVRTQVADALTRLERVGLALTKIHEALGTPFKPVQDQMRATQGDGSPVASE